MSYKIVYQNSRKKKITVNHLREVNDVKVIETTIKKSDLPMELYICNLFRRRIT